MRHTIKTEAHPGQINIPEGLSIFSRADVAELHSEGYGVIPLVETLPQRETAGALYERLRQPGESTFLLESAETDERQGRYSYIGLDAEKVVRLEADGMHVNGALQPFDNPYRFAEQLLDRGKVAPVDGLPPLFGGAAGLFGYDLARYAEPSIGRAKEDSLDLPEMALMVPGTTIAFDHYKQTVSLIRNLVIEPTDEINAVLQKYDAAATELARVKSIVTDSGFPPKEPTQYEPLTFRSNMEPEAFKSLVERSKEYLASGDIFQVVPSQRFSSEQSVDENFAHRVFEVLKRVNPSKYAFIFEFSDFQVAGCSPETLVSVQDGKLEHMALAGTRPRGANREEDERLASELRNDPKEIAEHDMLVDLSRNDVGRVCVAGTVEVPVYAGIDNHSHVMHMGSQITGTLRSDHTALSALESIAPAGTLSGAPKIRAMQIIDELETEKRGFYGGAAGFATYDGNLQSCIVIRSLVVDKNGKVHVQAGAGVVADSVPELELQETVLKAAAPIRAINEVCSSRPRKQTRQVEQKPKPHIDTIRKLGKHVVLIDNYDSYTYNLMQYLSESGADVSVLRNDVTAQQLLRENPDYLVVSPGSGTPEAAGISIEALRHFPEVGVPSLGVCLGHQALAVAFGGEVVRYLPMHGKTSQIEHDGKTIFTDIPSPTQVMRYHSLEVDADSLPDVLTKSAVAHDAGRPVIMGIRHRELPADGVQFHPEAFKTQAGKQMIVNFLAQSSSGVHE